ncbi:MAG: 16S rRNA (cytidine(1402)-2'-O)-methyltransferase, partial [Candidatus Saganbacteria bacterium]|nr:16S rRNA (cytidine(1402)-2'-O)-methyltransferase [Candidatus Saganbacteria bacterium]
MGTLFVVATPIGNLEDVTFRALRILGEVDLIAAEDTRKTRILLNRYAINTPMTSYHKFNIKSKIGYLINLMQQGKNIALVSDAGTPGISDPGSWLIASAVE